MRARIVWLAPSALGCVLFVSAATATVIDSNLNFATVNQNLWGPGQALVVDESITIPPPSGLSGTVDLATFEDPTSAIASFIGLDVGAKLSPTGTFNAALSASFHANSGSIDLNYPEKIRLTLPDTVQGGQPFTVSASLPGSMQPFQLQANSIAATVAAGGAGYAANGLSPFLSAPSNLFTPTAGFSTVFPYAEARVNLSLSASGSIDSSICLILCADGPTIDLGSVGWGEQLFELNTLNGLQVLSQPVVPFNQTVPLAQGVSIGFSSPNVSLDGALLGDGTLADTASKSFLDFSFNVDQLIPLVGALLQSNIGPIGYDLLSVTPTVSLGIRQEITFDPTPMVALQFDAPVLDSRDGQLKNTVVFAVGDSVTLTPTIGGGGILPSSTLSAKPTFFLDNTIHNLTELVLTGTLDVKALELDTPVTLGPAFDSGPIDLGEIPLLALDDRPWTLSIPSITRDAQTITRTGLGLQVQSLQYQADLVAGGGTNNLGHSKYDVYAGGSLLGEAFGQLVQTGGLGCQFAEIPAPDCQQFFISDDDLYGFNQEALGRYLCIVCNDLSSLFLATSPSLSDLLSGEKLFLSDLTSFPTLPGLDELLDPTNPLYDVQLAATQYFQSVSTRPAGVIPAPTSVPEPSTLALLAAGAFVAGFRRRTTRGWSHAGADESRSDPSAQPVA